MSFLVWITVLTYLLWFHFSFTWLALFLLRWLQIIGLISYFYKQISFAYKNMKVEIIDFFYLPRSPLIWALIEFDQFFFQPTPYAIQLPSLLFLTRNMLLTKIWLNWNLSFLCFCGPKHLHFFPWLRNGRENSQICYLIELSNFEFSTLMRPSCVNIQFLQKFYLVCWVFRVVFQGYPEHADSKFCSKCNILEKIPLDLY